MRSRNLAYFGGLPGGRCRDRTCGPSRATCGPQEAAKAGRGLRELPWFRGLDRTPVIEAGEEIERHVSRCQRLSGRPHIPLHVGRRYSFSVTPVRETVAVRVKDVRQRLQRRRPRLFCSVGNGHGPALSRPCVRSDSRKRRMAGALRPLAFFGFVDHRDRIQ